MPGISYSASQTASIADQNGKEKSSSLKGVALTATMLVIMVGITPVITIVMEAIMRLLLLLRVFITLRKRPAIRQDVIDVSVLDKFTLILTFSDRLREARSRLLE